MWRALLGQWLCDPPGTCRQLEKSRQDVLKLSQVHWGVWASVALKINSVKADEQLREGAATMANRQGYRDGMTRRIKIMCCHRDSDVTIISKATKCFKRWLGNMELIINLCPAGEEKMDCLLHRLKSPSGPSNPWKPLACPPSALCLSVLFH